MCNLDFEHGVKQVWEKYYCARIAFDAGNKEGFEAQMRKVGAAWQRIVEARSKHESRAAVKLFPLIGDVPKK